MLKTNENERISWNDYLIHPFFQKNFQKFNLPEFNCICKNHFEPFELYCLNCKLNICKLCKDYHNQHQIILFSDIGLSQSELKQMENLIKIFENNINDINKIKIDVENLINKMKLINKNNMIYDDNSKENYKEYYISCLNLINKQLESIGKINFKSSSKFNYMNNDFLFKFSIKQDYEKRKKLCKKYLNNFENIKNNSSSFKYLKKTIYDSEIFIFEPSSSLKAAIKRIKIDLIDYFRNNYEGTFIFSFINNSLKGVIEGPSNTPYENGIFYFRMRFSSDYPFKPPAFNFITKIYHPNIDLNGNVSIVIFKDHWSPAFNLGKVLFCLLSILYEPDPVNGIYNGEACKLYNENREEYNKIARNYTKQYANYDIFKRTLIINENNCF